MTTTKKFRAIALVPFLLMLSLTACSDQALTNLSKALADVSQGVAALQQSVIDGNKAQLISDGDTETILRLCFKINAAGQQASAITRKLTQLDPTSRGSVLTILKPIIAAVNDAVATGVLGIKNPATQATIQTTLVTIQTALNSAQVILAATGSN